MFFYFFCICGNNKFENKIENFNQIIKINNFNKFYEKAKKVSLEKIYLKEEEQLFKELENNDCLFSLLFFYSQIFISENRKINFLSENILEKLKQVNFKKKEKDFYSFLELNNISEQNVTNTYKALYLYCLDGIDKKILKKLNINIEIKGEDNYYWLLIFFPIVGIIIYMKTNKKTEKKNFLEKELKEEEEENTKNINIDLKDNDFFTSEMVD